jgi:hypothetical protein
MSLTRWPPQLPPPERKPESWKAVVGTGLLLIAVIGLLIMIGELWTY